MGDISIGRETWKIPYRPICLQVILYVNPSSLKSNSSQKVLSCNLVLRFFIVLEAPATRERGTKSSPPLFLL